jgi:succinate dehydrogenase / fumarate reductase membrane anchor subunit
MSLVTPLNRVLGLGSAKEGAEHWWKQRLTAVALIPLGLWLAFAFLSFDDFSYAAASEWLRAPLNGALLVLTLLTLTYHSALGIQVVIEDYVHGKGVKVVSLVLSAFAHAVVALAGVFAVLGVAFGAGQ